MKQWVKKLFEQFDIDVKDGNPNPQQQFSEEKATLLYLLDIYNKHLFEIDGHPVRKTRETLDEFTKGFFNANPEQMEKLLFRFRQWFASYRIDEFSYIQNTFDDFKSIIWDFADQLAEDVRFERMQESELKDNLEDLKEAVEANSIDALRIRSREFIDAYVEYQTKKDERRNVRMDSIKKNLDTVKKQLSEANDSLQTDHLTGAYNRRFFDNQLKEHVRNFRTNAGAVSLIVLDIDFFKKVNDSYGHDIGDFVLKECVRLLKESFHRDQDVVARIGGEEFAIVIPQYRVEDAVKKAEDTLNKIRKAVFVHGELKLSFTVSMGIAQLMEGESFDQWLKRADSALYQSKNSGRNKYTVAPHITKAA